MLTVKLGEHEVLLRLPPSFAMRRAVEIAATSSAPFALGAALGLCWAAKPLKTTLKAHGFSMPEYGAAVLDELHALGVPEADIWEAASKAFGVLTGSVPTEAGVEAAAGFSAPTSEASTS